MKFNKSARSELKKAASSGGRKALPVGKYVMTLTKLELSKKEGPAGPYYIAEYTIPKDEKFGGRKVWDNMSLSEGARFKWVQLHTAYGDEEFTEDNVDFVGQKCVVVLAHGTQKAGAGMGELRNIVKNLLPLTEDEEDEDEDDDDDDDSDDEDEI